MAHSSSNNYKYTIHIVLYIHERSCLRTRNRPPTHYLYHVRCWVQVYQRASLLGDIRLGDISTDRKEPYLGQVCTGDPGSPSRVQQGWVPNALSMGTGRIHPCLDGVVHRQHLAYTRCQYWYSVCRFDRECRRDRVVHQ